MASPPSAGTGRGGRWSWSFPRRAEVEMPSQRMVKKPLRARACLAIASHPNGVDFAGAVVADVNPTPRPEVFLALDGRPLTATFAAHGERELGSVQRDHLPSP